MAKLTKAEAKLHAQAVELLKKDVLSEDDRRFVLENWQESANHVNSAAGAFFTPYDMAGDFALDVGPGRVIDLCAGIGTLSRAILDADRYGRRNEIVCIEINPSYIEVGRKIVPEATWIQADVFDVLGMDLGRFDCAVSNPPFGRVRRQDGKRAPRYTGADFEFHVIDIAAHLARYGVFILPQMSAGFKYSGQPFYDRHKDGKAVEFQKLTGLHFEAGVGVDTTIFRDQWHGVAPICEIVSIEFTAPQFDEREVQEEPAPGPSEQAKQFDAAADGQLDMFGRAA
ncbi:methyltransferase [Consotaella aegiceratis]|uniref:methyltransferase n=1 Tax=Consotaella aegiceratis TaxID=3097961 RepID=UPI002F40D77F